MLADIGGFIELIKFVFYYIVSIFSIKRFMSYIYQQMHFENVANIQNHDNLRRVHNISDNSSKFSNRIDYVNTDLSSADVNLPSVSEDSHII